MPGYCSQPHTGDIVLSHRIFYWYRTSTWLSALIRRFTKSKFDHSGIIIYINRQYKVIEILRRGFTSTEYDQWAKAHRNCFELLRPEQKVVPPKLAQEVTQFKYCGYDFKGLFFNQPIKQIFKRWVGGEPVCLRRFTCSTFVGYMYRCLFPEWYTLSPQDLVSSGFFKPVK